METTSTKGLKTITLDELQQSVTENDLGRTPINGITMYDYFSEALDCISKNKVKFDLGEIFVSDAGGIKIPGISVIPKLEEIYGQGSVKAHIFRRGITNITFPEYGDDDSTSGIALNFFQGGMQLAYGHNIRICTNLNIYGGTIISSYGIKGVGVKRMVDVLTGWIHKLGALRQQDLYIQERLREITLKPEEYKLVLGDLILNAVKDAYIDSRSISILNIGQVTALTRAMLEAGEKLVTADDLLNFGTQVVKPHNTSTSNLIDHLGSYGTYITKRYVPELELIDFSDKATVPLHQD